MKDILPEDIICIASLLTKQLAKNCTKQELINYRILFQTLANDLQTIIFYEMKQKIDPRAKLLYLKNIKIKKRAFCSVFID